MPNTYYVQVAHRTTPLRILADAPPTSSGRRLDFTLDGQRAAEFNIDHLIGWWTEPAEQSNG